MPGCAVRFLISALIFLITFSSAEAQDPPLSAAAETSSGATAAAAPRALRASEVMALEAGAALEANIAFDITKRGLNFHPDGDFLSLMKKAGAETVVIAALNAAKVSGDGAVNPDMELLQKLAAADVLMKNKKYADAGAKLSDALDTSFARLETGFVMAELLRQQKDFKKASAVYAQIVGRDPDFPEVHDKASYVLYRLDQNNDAITEAKAALAFNSNDAEAHKNEALALSQDQHYEAAISEFKEALRLKPDYAEARSGLGLVYIRIKDYPSAIAECKKALEIDPNYDDAHNNLGLALKASGSPGAAVVEFRAAKRLSPNFPDFRQNLALVLMDVAPVKAVQELKELEAKFPDFEMCHVCLGNGLLSENDGKAAEAEYRWAAKLDPMDPEPHERLGDLEQRRKNYDAALEEYRIAEKIGPSNARAYERAAKLLIEKKDYASAASELQQAMPLAPSDWEVHELYGTALLGTGQADLAVAEFKQAVTLDPKQGQVMTELGEALEKKGDWVGALEQYRKGALTDANRIAKVQPGGSYVAWSKDPRKEYRFAKARFANYVVSLKRAGKKEEAAELEKRAALVSASGSTRGKLQEAIQTGNQAIHDRRFDDAVRSFKEAVVLGQRLPPGDENLIVALRQLGNAYSFQQKYTEAEEAFHQELKIIEKTFGRNYPRVTDPLFFLGSNAAGQKDFVAAEGYFSRALDINVRSFGENSTRTAESLRWLAGLYMAQQDWARAEPFLLRAVKASEAAVGPDNQMTLIPLYGLCDLYDRWEKPEKSQPCWARAIGIIAEVNGESSLNLRDPLTFEAKALRKLGRYDEAGDIEQRLQKIQNISASN